MSTQKYNDPEDFKAASGNLSEKTSEEQIVVEVIMLKLRHLFDTTHLSTRSMAKNLVHKMEQDRWENTVLDFSEIEFASRSFMIQLYSMLAKKRAQVRLINMNDNVQQMYQLAVTSYNTPSVKPENSKDADPEVLNL